MKWNNLWLNNSGWGITKNLKRETVDGLLCFFFQSLPTFINRSNSIKWRWVNQECPNQSIDQTQKDYFVSFTSSWRLLIRLLNPKENNSEQGRIPKKKIKPNKQNDNNNTNNNLKKLNSRASGKKHKNLTKRSTCSWYASSNLTERCRHSLRHGLIYCLCFWSGIGSL